MNEMGQDWRTTAAALMWLFCVNGGTVAEGYELCVYICEDEDTIV